MHRTSGSFGTSSAFTAIVLAMKIYKYGYHRRRKLTKVVDQVVDPESVQWRADAQRVRITVKALADAFQRDSTHTVEIELSLAEVSYLVEAALQKVDVRRLRTFAGEIPRALRRMAPTRSLTRPK